MKTTLLHRKEALIVTAIEVMDELGIQGLSTREIARRQGVSEATLFRHFKNKNELLLAVLSYDSKYEDDIAASIRLKKLEPIEAILYSIDTYSTYYENYPAITAIMQAYDVLACDPNLSETVKKNLNNRMSYIEVLIQEAQQQGKLMDTIKPQKLRNILLGSFYFSCLRWRMSNYQFSLKEDIMSTTKAILKQFSREERDKQGGEANEESISCR